MFTKITVLLFTLLAFALQAPSQGASIGSFLVSAVNGMHLVRTNATFWFGESPDFFPPYPEANATIFENLSLTSADVGRIFTVKQGDDPGFSYLTSLLTNGVPDRFGYLVNNSSGSGAIERDMFDPLPGGDQAVDFQGFRIDQFSLEVLGITISSPGQNLGNDGRWTDINMSLRFSVIGEAVPEPSLVALTSAAGGSLMLLRLRGRKI